MIKKFTAAILLLFVSTGLLRADSPVTKVYAKAGQLFVVRADGKANKLPMTGASDPCLSLDKRSITFVKSALGKPIPTGSDNAPPNQIWLTDVLGKSARCLVRSRDSAKIETLLAGLSAPRFSQDSSQVYFLSSAWATSDAVHAVDVKTGAVRFICPGNSLEVVPRGDYKGDLVVSMHKYFVGSGSYEWYWLVTPAGKEIGPVGDDDNRTAFWEEVTR